MPVLLALCEDWLVQEVLRQPPNTAEEVAVGNEEDVLCHSHSDQSPSYFCQSAEGHIIDEKQVDIRLTGSEGSVDSFAQAFGNHPADGVPCVGHPADGIVHAQGLSAIPVFLRNGMSQQSSESCIRHVMHITGTIAVQFAVRARIRHAGTLDFQLAAQADILAGRSDQDVICAALNLELVGRGVEVAEGVPVEGNRNKLFLASFQMDAAG